MAVAELRRRWPALAIVGVEPGLKPALAATRNGRIGVMATVATLRSERFQALLRRVLEPAGPERRSPRCTSTFSHVRGWPTRSNAANCTLRNWPGRSSAGARCCCAPSVDTVVLGCTHYPLVAPLIARALGCEVQLVDTAEAVARQAARRWFEERTADLVTLPAGCSTLSMQTNAAPSAPVRYLGSGDLAALRLAVTHWLGEPDPAVGRLAC